MNNTAASFFASKLAYEIDPSDLVAERASDCSPTVIDTRSTVAWRSGRIPGAIHIPNEDLKRRAAEAIPGIAAPVVVYCWGPGCNGSTRAALTLVQLGYTNVRELIGGFEYWSREGLATVSDDGRGRLEPDPLVAPSQARP